MGFPYRTPASIDADASSLRSAGLERWLRAVSGAAVIFLLSATAALIALVRDHALSRRFHEGLAHSSHAKLAVTDAAAGARQARATPLAAETNGRPPRSSAFIAPLGLAALGAVTHDPATLASRAARLLRDGADLTLTRTTLPRTIDRAVAEAFAPYARIASHRSLGGVEIQRLPPGSIASLAGLQRGDVVTAINGYALTTPEAEMDAYRSVTESRVALLELIRDEQRIVLEARFNPAPRSAGVAP